MINSIESAIIWFFIWPLFLYFAYLFTKNTAKKVDAFISEDESEKSDQ